MFRNKLKKIACIALASVLTFNGVQYQAVDVKAADNWGQASKYDTFADAVEDMYKGNIVGVKGDYELVNFANSYQYSVSKKSVNELLSVGSSCNTYQAQNSCLWEVGKITRPQPVTDDNGNYIDGAYQTVDITIKGRYTNVAIADVNNSKNSYRWDYDVAAVKIEEKATGISYANTKTLLCAVNVRPTKPLEGDITLPAYIKDSTYGLGLIPCVEIGDGAFLKNTKLTSVNIPNTYQRICAYAFTGCECLESVNFITVEQDSSLNLGYKVKTNTTAEENIKNSDIHMIGAGAFAGCSDKEGKTGLKTPVLPTVLTEAYGVTASSANNYSFLYYTMGNGKVSVGKNTSSKYNLSPNASSSLNYKYCHKEGNAVEYGLYFMGEGVYRDCYCISKVGIEGINPYIPNNTFSGCSGISEITVADSVKNIVFGLASFAGADNSDSTKRSKLKELKLGVDEDGCGRNLESVTIAPYAFKNNASLTKAEIKTDLNTRGLTFVAQNTSFEKGINAFEGSFNKGVFIYEPDNIVYGSDGFEIPSGFFKDCDMKSVSLMENVYNIEESEKQEEKYRTVTNKLSIEPNAFEGAECSEGVTFKAYTIDLKTGSLYNFNAKSIKFTGALLNAVGEPFSNSLDTAKTANTTPNLSRVVVDTKEFVVSMEGITEPNKDPSSTKTFTHTTAATFYGVGDNTDLVFTDNVVTAQMPESLRDRVHYPTSGTDEQSYSYPRNAFGEITKVHFQGCSTKVMGRCSESVYPSALVVQGSNGTYKSVCMYADGDTKTNLNTFFKGINYVTINGYSSQLKSASTYWVVTEEEFKPERVTSNNETGGILVTLGDGSSKKIEYSLDGDMVKGYTIAEKDMELLKETAESGKICSLDVTTMHRGLTGSLKVDIVPKRALDFSVVVKDESSIVEGKEPSKDNYLITNVKFNDDTTEEIVSDMKDVKVSLGYGSTYAKENMVTVEYMGYSKTILVSAVPEKVVSMSAIQVKDKIYTGDTLTKDDFEVIAYYNSAREERNYTDFEVVTQEVSDKTKFATLRNSEGVEATVELNVIPLTAEDITVSYNGTAVNEGEEVDKKNFVVKLIYNNGTIRELEEDEYNLVYSDIVGNSVNTVKVEYVEDKSLNATVIVTGIKIIPTDMPATDVPTTESAPPVVTTSSNPVVNQSAEPATSTAICTTPAISTTSTPVVKPTDSVVTDNTLAPIVTGTPNVGNISSGGDTVKATNPAVSSAPTNSPVATTAPTTAPTASASTSTTPNATVSSTVDKIKVTPKKKVIKKGKKATIKVTLPTGYSKKNLSFKSSNKKIATVNSKGVIRAKKKGSCKITVKYLNSKKATIKITVK